MDENKKVVIIGIGSLLMMDDGIGIHVINQLERQELPGNVEIYDGGTGGYRLTDLIHGAERVIFVDAAEIGEIPGTVRIFKSEDVHSLYPDRKYSLHDTDLLDVIKMLSLLERPPEIEIVGIQPKTVNYGTALSRELRDSLPDITNTVLNMVKTS